MLKDLHTLTPYLDFYPDLQCRSRLPRSHAADSSSSCTGNLLDAPENPNTRVFGTFEGETLTGVFARWYWRTSGIWNCWPDFSRSAAAYAELLSHLKSAHPGYQADFVYNPRNRLFYREALCGAGRGV